MPASLRHFRLRSLPTSHLAGWLALLLAIAALPAHGDDPHLLERVQAFLHEQARAPGDEVSVEVYPPAARFPECRQPSPFLPRGEARPLGRVSVGVRCGEDSQRVRYLQAEVRIIGRHLVAARDIAAGETITPALLETRRAELSRLPRQALRDEARALGQQAERPLARGQIIQAHQLRAPRLVKRGQRVTVEARGAGFRVTREGRALDSGGQGERLRVRFGRREILEAQVVGPGRLAVDF